MLTALALSRLRKAAKYVLVSLTLLLLCGPPARASNLFLHFDPASCKHDTGHMYVALGRAVLIVPTPKQANSLVEPLPPNKYPYNEPPLKVPDPAEPAGCFGNPLQSSRFDLLWSDDLVGNAPGDTRFGVPQLLTLSGDRHPAVDRKRDDGGFEAFWRKIADDTCRRATVREDLPNGIRACRVKPTSPPNAPQVDWGASYIAKKSVYTTPSGNPFVVNCDSGLSSSAIGHCGVAYKYSPYLFITYTNGTCG